MASVSWSARAEAILVVRPDAADAMLTETFGRLCGELRMYGFTLRLADREDGVSGNQGDVVGGVSLFRAPGQANARIWIADASTGKRSLGITVSIDDADAPSLLAIRAADLLRASLRDFDRAEGQARHPPVVESGSPSTVALARKPGPWSLHAGMDALWETNDLGLGWAAHGGASWWFTPRLALGLEIVAPVTAQSYAMSFASAHLRGYLGLAALRWRAWAGTRLSLDLVQGLGADYLSVRGEAQSRWSGQSTATWTAASWTGACLDFALSQHTGLMLSVAAVFLLPRPTLDIADTSYTIRQPLLVTNVGFRYAF